MTVIGDLSFVALLENYAPDQRAPDAISSSDG
jgi:hypothetical protein